MQAVIHSASKQTSADQTDVVASSDGRWEAVFMSTPDSWMAGAIHGKTFMDTAERRAFADEVFAAIVAVDESQLPYSSCTDGRKRLTTLDGAAVPVREQVVGTDTMCAFVAAEALGAHFYGDKLYAPVEERIRLVVRYMLDKGFRPTAHIACGAAGGFTTVINRATQFIKDPAYARRMRQLADDNYSDTLHYLIVGSYQSRLVSGAYEGYEDGLVARIVQEMVGLEAVETYEDDDRGVHGHREQAIVYLDQAMQGFAVDPNAMINATDHQVFVVSCSRIDRLAVLMSGDRRRGIDYLTARLAIEDFSSAGHGTLAAGIETIVVSPAGFHG